MKILITGATGLVGKAVIQHCLEKKWEVHYLSTSQKKLDVLHGCKGFYWDTASGYTDESCLEGVEVIVHLAGASISNRWTKAYKEEILNSRIFSTRTLYRLLKNNPKHTVKQIVCASAIGIYPHHYFEEYDETTEETGNSFLSTVVDKWETETDVFKTLQIKTAKVRIGVVLAKNGGALAEMSKPVKNGYGAVLGCGEQWISWIHLDDLAGIFMKLIIDKKEGVYNGVAPHPVTNKTLTHTLAHLLGKKIWLPPVPSFILKLILGEMAVLVLNSTKVSAQKIVRCGYDFKYPELSTALTDLLKE